jgi:hypothetical protein
MSNWSFYISCRDGIQKRDINNNNERTSRYSIAISSMASRFVLLPLLFASLSPTCVTAAPVTKRNPYNFILNNPSGGTIFELGDTSYLANTKHPKARVGCTITASGASSPSIPVTVIKTNETVITEDILEPIISTYLERDDVFSHDFLDGLYISSSVQSSISASALAYLDSFNSTWLFLDPSVTTDATGLNKAVLASPLDVPAGPYLASIDDATSVSLATVYRLYADTYKTFLFGAYDANDGENAHVPLGVVLPKYQDPMIPLVTFLFLPPFVTHSSLF